MSLAVFRQRRWIDEMVRSSTTTQNLIFISPNLTSFWETRRRNFNLFMRIFTFGQEKMFFICRRLHFSVCLNTKICWTIQNGIEFAMHKIFVPCFIEMIGHYRLKVLSKQIFWHLLDWMALKMLVNATNINHWRRFFLVDQLISQLVSWA